MIIRIGRFQWDVPEAPELPEGFRYPFYGLIGIMVLAVLWFVCK